MFNVINICSLLKDVMYNIENCVVCTCSMEVIIILIHCMDLKKNREGLKISFVMYILWICCFFFLGGGDEL